MMSQMSLIVRMKRLEDFGCFTAQCIVIGRQVSQAPVSQLIRIMDLNKQDMISSQTFEHNIQIPDRVQEVKDIP